LAVLSIKTREKFFGLKKHKFQEVFSFELTAFRSDVRLLFVVADKKAAAL
jgi:hypothetical protein